MLGANKENAKEKMIQWQHEQIAKVEAALKNTINSESLKHGQSLLQQLKDKLAEYVSK